MLTLQSYMSGVVGAFSLIINNLMRANNVVTNILRMPSYLGCAYCILHTGKIQRNLSGTRFNVSSPLFLNRGASLKICDRNFQWLIMKYQPMDKFLFCNEFGIQNINTIMLTINNITPDGNR